MPEVASESGGFLDFFKNFFSEENLDKNTIMLDTIGSALSPQNSFAGVGTKLGKSNIAAKAQKEIGEKQDSFAEMLRSVLSGNPTKSGISGFSGMNVKPGPTGKPEISISGTVDGLDSLMNEAKPESGLGAMAPKKQSNMGTVLTDDLYPF